MAEAVAGAIASKSHLIAEAGTGVGKSFAYLVPVMLAAAARQDREKGRKRIVVSTHTISLQEQLIRKDLPFLNAVLPIECSAVLVKGRSNYISLRRLKGAAERSSTLFSERDEVQQLSRIRQWAGDTTDGSLTDLGFRPLGSVWDEVRSEHGNCLSRKCPTYEQCHYYAARRRAWNADILIVNHALFFSDLALRREGASVLPDYDVAILDEAHTVEAVAGDHMGLSVTNGQLTYLFNRLYNDRTHKGLLLHHNLMTEQQLVQRLRYVADDFFSHIAHWLERQRGNGRARSPVGIDTPLMDDLRHLAVQMNSYAERLEEEAQKIELTASADRLVGLSLALDTWLKQSQDDSVYWAEQSGRQRQNIKLVSAPIDVGPVLRDELFNQVDTVVLTSATLSVGESDFGYFRSRIGLTKSEEIKLGSPFDYRSQARLIIANRMPDPSTQANEFEQAACERIKRHLLETEGRAFVLFTSYKMLQTCANKLTPWCASHNLLLLCQGAGTQRSALLDKFKQEDRAVLFGTESFWQGVDVPGDALQNVIITRLPFSVPDHPLLQARVERIRENGGNPFMDYQVPEAVIKLRQGFGRLIRSKSDTGQVVILDPRIRTKPYGRTFLESLPTCELIIDDDSH
ncbi:MAG: helicase [Planctomycetaceae bacterium]|nr:helicase [Planctomycetaceae bacterium]